MTFHLTKAAARFREVLHELAAELADRPDGLLPGETMQAARDLATFSPLWGNQSEDAVRSIAYFERRLARRLLVHLLAKDLAATRRAKRRTPRGGGATW